jgi:DNA-binding FrmR family transcriptional regulator
MTYGYTHNKEAVSKRLKRIEGQVRGIENMVEDDKYCIDILTQISAVQSALDKVGLELLREHTRHCLTNPDIGPKTIDEKTDELITVISRIVR